MKNGDNPAYPISTTEHTGFTPTHEKIFTTTIEGGLTKREMFAMAAMQGIVAGYGCYIPSCEYASLMSQAVQIADELLKALEE